MANTTRSRKAKGTRLEKQVAKRIEEVLGDYGVEATRMVMSGAVDRFKSDIFTNLPVSIECKNQERLNFWQAWRQADKDAQGTGKIPILVASKNREPEPLALVKFEDLLFLMELAVQNGWVQGIRKTKRRGTKTKKPCEKHRSAYPPGAEETIKLKEAGIIFVTCSKCGWELS